jgi:hypothetical protein
VEGFIAMNRFLALIAVAATVSACTATQAPGRQAAAGMAGRQCFTAGQVNSFHPIDQDTILVRTGASTYYQLDILGTCPEINWTARVGIRSTGGGSWICRGQDAEIVVPNPGRGFDRCPVLGVRLLSPDEAKAALAR